MTRANFVKKARKNIYRDGVDVEKVHKRGKNAGQKYTTTDKSKRNPNGDEIRIAKGESYYWWKFRFGGLHISKTRPKQSQLTQSEFLGTMYDIQDTISELTVDDDFESSISEITSELETLRDECEERRGNMPEQLQDSGSGEMLQNRYDEVDNMISELEGVDVEVDEGEIKEDVKANAEKEEGETQEEFKDRVEEETEEEIENKREDVLSEIQGIKYCGE